jgi:chromosome segregation ATPase
MKLKECSRCKGKGFGTWAPQMGVCYKCNGAGKVEVLTKREKIERRIADLKKHRTEVENIGNEFKAAIESASPKRVAFRNNYTEQLERRREQWKQQTAEINKLEATL